MTAFGAPEVVSPEVLAAVDAVSGDELRAVDAVSAEEMDADVEGCAGPAVSAAGIVPR